MEKYSVRKSQPEDKNQILELYKKVSQTIGGLARTNDEITESYIESFTAKSQKNGIQLILTDNLSNNLIIAEIHCYKLEPKVFGHILSELTIAVDPNYQRLGLGKLIFKSLLDIIQVERTDILRIELVARESNVKAIQFYQKLGFVIEGRFEKRIQNENNQFEADIPMAWFNKNYLLNE
jgi:ribosomal protein S18 acetylase RimI-like enzyme